MSAGQVAWPLVFAAYLVFIAVWCAIGWLDAGIGALDMAVWSAVQAACGLCTLARRPVLDWIESLPRRWPRESAQGVTSRCWRESQSRPL